MTITKERIQVVTSVERRRRWAPEEKCSIVQETYQPGMSVSLIARKHGINPCQLFMWRRLMEEGAMNGIRSQEEVVPKSQLKELERQLRETQRILGKKTLENEILREAVKLAQEKKLISRQPLPGVENFQSEQ
jgi:transposase